MFKVVILVGEAIMILCSVLMLKNEKKMTHTFWKANVMSAIACCVIDIGIIGMGKLQNYELFFFLFCLIALSIVALQMLLKIKECNK